MADIDIKQTEQLPASTQTKYKDMGDGTHAETLYIGGINLTTDDITGVLVTQDIVHHETHEGEMFQASYKTPDDGNVADNGTIDLLLITDHTKYPHLTFNVTAGGDCEVALYEAVTTSSNGTGLTAHNMKRYSTIPATVDPYHTPTVSDTGTLLHNTLEPGGTGPQSPGGTARRESEWILKLSTKYLIRGTNRAGTAQPMSIVAQWYEESEA